MNLLVCWKGIPQETIDLIAEKTKANIWVVETSDQATDYIPKSDVILGFFAPRLLREAARCKWVQVPYAGVDKLVQEQWANPDMILTNGSGIFGPCIAEHVMAMILGFNRGLHIARDYQGKKKWEWDSPYAFRELSGATVGILGYGDIGSNVAKRLQGFDAKVYGFRRTVRGTEQYVDGMYSYSELHSELPNLDYLVCALPHTKDTVGIINKEVFSLLPKHAVLINVGRGSAVNEGDLVEAVESGMIFGAGLDVTREEPLGEDSKLWSTKNIVLTPHNSGMTPHHLARAIDIFLRNWPRFLKGESMINEVDRELGY